MNIIQVELEKRVIAGGGTPQTCSSGEIWFGSGGGGYHERNIDRPTPQFLVKKDSTQEELILKYTSMQRVNFGSGDVSTPIESKYVTIKFDALAGKWFYNGAVNGDLVSVLQGPNCALTYYGGGGAIRLDAAVTIGSVQ